MARRYSHLSKLQDTFICEYIKESDVVWKEKEIDESENALGESSMDVHIRFDVTESSSGSTLWYNANRT